MPVPEVMVDGGAVPVDGATVAEVAFVVGSWVREDRMDDRISVDLAVPVVVAGVEVETPVPTPVWLIPLDRATELLVVLVLGFSRLLMAESSDERGSTGAEDEAEAAVVLVVLVVPVVAADESAEAVDDVWGNTTMPDELSDSDSLLEASVEALVAGALVVLVADSVLLLSDEGVLVEGGTTMVLVAIMTVVTRSSDEDASRAWELVDDRLVVALWPSVRLIGCELEKMSDDVSRLVVPVLLDSLSELEAEPDRLDSIIDCRLVGARVGGGGA